MLKLKIRILTMMSILVLVGCANLAKTPGAELESGTHKISVFGDAIKSRDNLQAKIDEKAARLCGGEENYEFIDGLVAIDPESEVTVEGSHRVYSRVVRCR